MRLRRDRAAGAAAVTGVVLALALAGGAQTPPQTPPSAQARAAAMAGRAAERIAALRREADALARQETTLLGEIRKLEVERDLRVEELAEIEASLQALARERDEAAARQAGLEQEVKTMAPALRARLVEIYKLGRGGYLRLFLGVDDLRAAGRAYRTVSLLARRDRAQASAYRAAVAELRATTRSLEERTARMQALQAAARVARESAEKAVRARAALIARIDARRDLNARLMGELDAARERLRALQVTAPAAQPGGRAAPLLPLRPFRGDLPWPVDGRLVSRFGQRRNPRFGTSTYQSGIVIAAPAGTPVLAIHEGVVAYAEPFTGFGNLVIVDHGNQAFSLYAYLASVLVSRGTPVVHLQPVGTVGATPAGDVELYLELRIDGKPVDPLQWLKRRD